MPDLSIPRDEDAASELQRRAEEILRLQQQVAQYDPQTRETVQALTAAIEDFNREALRRLLRALKSDPSATDSLRAALADPVIAGVLQVHGLLREPLERRLQHALAEVRPLLAGHGGDVELVAIHPPNRADIRLTGSCQGCASSAQTLRDGVQTAVRRHCPEITDLREIASPVQDEAVVHFISPFAAEADRNWLDGGLLDDIPDGGVRAHVLDGRAVLLGRDGQTVSCFDNRCAHLGRPLDDAAVSDGTLTCPYHGLRFHIATGECLDLPGVQLDRHPARVVGTRVQVRLEGER